jgi:aquaporin Z
MEYSLDRKLAVEFIGTFIFAFTVGMATQQTNRAGQILAPIAIGFVLMVMVFAGGHISGGHYNPAVSTAVLIRGKMTPIEWVGYVIAQLAAAALGGLLARGIGGHELAGVLPGAGKIFVAELVFTIALAYTVLNVATARGTEGNSFYGLAIGGIVLVGAITVGWVSGAAFNPAIALGASITGVLAWSHFWIYVVAPLLGGALAAGLFLYVQPAEKPEGDIQAARTGGAADELT